jgi:mannose-1-phosphate guanylyltransferase/mannose-1-phosphate guanylyltransferase/mannose-6-phosphate isomerase
MSRSERPKQLLSLTDSETMLQLTARRTMNQPGFASPIVVANTAHAVEIERQLAHVGITDATIVLEPAARNTAPAIALAALAADPSAMLLVMPSDHIIDDVDAFMVAVAAALPLCAGGWFATFGITPDAPETGYGYMRRGEQLAPGVSKVERFVEKPNLETARSYLASGDYSWNGGIFLFTAASYLSALGRLEPAMLAAATESMRDARREGGLVYPDALAFGTSPSESVDYAVMEKVDRVAVVPVDMGWSDLGSWDALHAIAPRDATNNAHHGEVIAIDTSGCLLRTDGPLIAAVGIKDLIVIATGDAVLVLPRGSSQDVKKAIQALKREGHITLDQFTATRTIFEQEQ